MLHKVEYHKQARKHEQLKSVKRLINKAIVRAEKIDKNFCLPLTGVMDEDIRHVKYVMKNSVLFLANRLKEELDFNESENCFEFNLEKHQLHINWIKDMRNVITFIADNYVVNVRTNTLVFSEGLSNEQKKAEYINHYTKNPLSGFNKEYRAVYENGKQKTLYSLTLHISDLEGALRIETDYE